MSQYIPKHPEFIAGLIARKKQLEKAEEHRRFLESIRTSRSKSKPIVFSSRSPKPKQEATEDGDDYISDFLAVLNGDL